MITMKYEATSAFMVELEVEHKQPKMLFRAMMFK